VSLKEDINAVKNELDNEEKFLTAFVKTERFFKKYKLLFVSTLSFLVACAVVYVGYGYYEDARISSANDAYVKLLKNPADKDAAQTLKAKSKPLFDAYTLQSAVKNNDLKGLGVASTSSNKVIADIAAYELAAASGDAGKLSAYTVNKDAFLKDLAFFVLANKYIEQGDYKKARETLTKIGANSEIKEYAKYLTHAIVTFK
jgi:hypothetical protein